MTGRNPGGWPEPSHREVSAEVKWYSPTKGFGFVQLSDGSPDAFLHVSVVEQLGRQDLPDGTKIVCDIAEGRKGRQVAFIHRIEELGSGPARSAPRPGGFGGGGGGGGFDRDRGDRGGPDGPGPGGGGGGTPVDGTVKFFDAGKGYGFVTPDDGGKDVFISARTLGRVGLTTLENNQRVKIVVRMGQKGPMADSVEVLPD